MTADQNTKRLTERASETPARQRLLRRVRATSVTPLAMMQLLRQSGGMDSFDHNNGKSR